MHSARVGGREGDAGELATVGPTLRPGPPMLAAIVVARAPAPAKPVQLISASPPAAANNLARYRISAPPWTDDLRGLYFRPGSPVRDSAAVSRRRGQEPARATASISTSWPG